MRFDIETSRLTFMVGKPPRPVTKFGTEEIKLKDGQPLYSVELIAFSEDDETDKLTVKVMGKPDLPARSEVKVIGLTALPWENNGKFGISFSAESIQLAGKLAKAS